MTEKFISKINCLYENNKWEEILKLKVDIKDDKLHSLLWVWPSLENLKFLKEILEKFNLKGVSSIGCGSGLFEWLLQQYTGLEISGIEIDESWWTSKYATNKFLPMKFTKMPPKSTLFPYNHALLFCYFNNGEAFLDYIKIFKGNIVFIIGPGEGRGTLTNPEPFNANFGSKEWTLFDHQEVRDTKDFIAVYIREEIIPHPAIDR